MHTLQVAPWRDLGYVASTRSPQLDARLFSSPRASADLYKLLLPPRNDTRPYRAQLQTPVLAKYRQHGHHIRYEAVKTPSCELPSGFRPEHTGAPLPAFAGQPSVNMDDPGWAWPAWKFGMKRDDLFTTLHDRYNTFSYTLQDPEAFHHDVSEIAHDADSSEQFHRLMADRQQQRLRELNETLETLAVEIIANPKLMGSEQWQHALQMFRTKSYDSIVRYFASYLPDDYLDRHESQSTSSYSSFSEADSIHTVSTKASSADGASSHFLDDDFFPNGPVMTVEPCTFEHDAHHDTNAEGPLSPPHSEATHSECSASSPSDAESPAYSSTNPPSRSMSFSGSESGHLGPELMRRRFDCHDDETWQPDDCDTSVTSVCDSAETRSSCDDGVADVADDKTPGCQPLYFEDDDEFPAAQYPDDEFDLLDTPSASKDALESDTPTPRQESIATSYLEYKSMAARKLSPHRRSPSPKSHLVHQATGILAREVRRSPEEAMSKIQKPFQDPLRKRPKGKRRLD
ncbi:hypothetical protein TOPH_04242 [Tolypocladium ophioglossoides CBS 100239]|uniref:Uncharacterized protein n=1 Tax=Tolypocladium ophioglossoides (strain CBS 100239) TaxID=1163406 RepID=A0A0L0NAG2_TOLOC|nr:hypothetical protein TOPH_04242 [Tolypocladium ophioglossoides CBS 100239]